MINVIAIASLGTLAILVAAAYFKSRKARKESIEEMQDEILVNEPTPGEAPAPKKAPAPIEAKSLVEVLQTIPEMVEALTQNATVKEMVASQEKPAPKHRKSRRKPKPNTNQDNNPK